MKHGAWNKGASTARDQKQPSNRRRSLSLAREPSSGRSRGRHAPPSASYLPESYGPGGPFSGQTWGGRSAPAAGYPGRLCTPRRGARRSRPGAPGRRGLSGGRFPVTARPRPARPRTTGPRLLTHSYLATGCLGRCGRWLPVAGNRTPSPSCCSHSPWRAGLCGNSRLRAAAADRGPRAPCRW